MTALLALARPETPPRPPLPTGDRPRGAEPLSLLFEADRPTLAPARGGLTSELADAYAGDFRIPLRTDRPVVLANFVETIDGLVAFDDHGETGGGDVSGFSPTDRFVMGLLRAMADVIVIGAGTARSSRTRGWTPESVAPDHAASFRVLRRELGLDPAPTTVIVTRSGDIDPYQRALADPIGPIVLLAPSAAVADLEQRDFAPGVRIEAAGPQNDVSTDAIVGLAQELGARVVLIEGGPHLLGAFARTRLLDELFLTVSPQVGGRGQTRPLGLLEGTQLWPEIPTWADLVSVRRAGSHLFLRYRFGEEPS